jgi:hypothetical protein
MLTQAGYNDATIGRSEVLDYIGIFATARGWTAAQRAAALADVEAAFVEADAASWFGADVTTFWASVRDRAAANWSAFPYADKLLPVLGSAVATEQAERAREDEQSAATILGGTIEASAADARAAGAAAIDPKVLAGAAVVLVLVLVLVNKVR